MLSFDMVIETKLGEIDTTRKNLAITMAEGDLANLCISENSEILSINIRLVIGSSCVASSTRSWVNSYQIAGEN